MAVAVAEVLTSTSGHIQRMCMLMLCVAHFTRRRDNTFLDDLQAKLFSLLDGCRCPVLGRQWPLRTMHELAN